MNNKQRSPEMLMNDLVSTNASEIKEAFDKCQTEMELILLCRRLAYVTVVSQMFLRDYSLMHDKIKMLDKIMK